MSAWTTHIIGQVLRIASDENSCILLSFFSFFPTGLTHDEIIRNIFSKYICNVQTQVDRSVPEDFKNRSRDRFDVYKYTYHNGSLMLAGGLMVTKRHGDLAALSRIASDYSILTVIPSPNLPVEIIPPYTRNDSSTKMLIVDSFVSRDKR